MFALVALDVVASLVLLNGRVAVEVGTLLRVGDEPQVVGGELLLLVRVAHLLGLDLHDLLIPVAPVLARGGLVALLQAVPARVVAHAAVDRARVIARRVEGLLGCRGCRCRRRRSHAATAVVAQHARGLAHAATRRCVEVVVVVVVVVLTEYEVAAFAARSRLISGGGGGGGRGG